MGGRIESSPAGGTSGVRRRSAQPGSGAQPPASARQYPVSGSLVNPGGFPYFCWSERQEAPRLYRTLSWVADQILAGRHDYANLEAAARAELAKHGWKVDYIVIRHGLALRIPHPEGYDHPNLLIVLGAAMLGTTRLIDNVDVVQGAPDD